MVSRGRMREKVTREREGEEEEEGLREEEREGGRGDEALRLEECSD